MSKATTVPIPVPTITTGFSASVVVSGQPIPPIERIKIFGATQWEEFVLEWVDSLRTKYSLVERCGSAGDMGRDIIATCADPTDGWDNYQCKHYDHSLQPSDIWLELGKLVYYTKRGDYSYPRKYYFVAPQGAGTTLSNLFKQPSQLRAGLIAAWDKKCRGGITSTATIGMDQDLRNYIDGLTFSIFEAMPPLRLIEEHAMTRWHVFRFGGGLPPRPPAAIPPADPATKEANYVRRLLDAYGDYLKRAIGSIGDLSSKPDLLDHFGDSRIEFYSAESLRAFSRDTLPPGEFEKLQDEVHSGIIEPGIAKVAIGRRR